MNSITMQAAALIDQTRIKNPLVHQITNYVTVNDCANITLAAGASPIMADDIGEAAEIAALASALVINIGTLNERTIASMLAAGLSANERNLPVVLDPVGAGASDLRNRTTRDILAQVKLAVLRGNLSEVSFVAGLQATTRGVDASAADARNDAASVAQTVARRFGCVVAITGPVDVLTDGKRLIRISNGHPMLSRITGTGCMATALVGAYCGVSEDPLIAAVAGIAAMGIAGEIAYEKAGSLGTGSFRAVLLDAVSLLDRSTFEARARIDEA